MLISVGAILLPVRVRDSVRRWPLGVAALFMVIAALLLVRAAVPSVPSYYIGNLVWHDLNRNGQPHAGEPGLNGVMVKAYRTADHALLGSQVTQNNGNSDGAYVFSINGVASVYLVFDLPNGFTFTSQHQGTDDSLDSDVDPFTGRTDPIRADPAKPPGQAQNQWDAGLLNKLYERASAESSR